MMELGEADRGGQYDQNEGPVRVLYAPHAVVRRALRPWVPSTELGQQQGQFIYFTFTTARDRVNERGLTKTLTTRQLAPAPGALARPPLGTAGARRHHAALGHEPGFARGGRVAAHKRP
eukprot:COSAG06_NODE_2277_length_7190_cov_3.824848_7_plen_119_part_00